MDENNKEETIRLIELIGYEKTLKLLKQYIDANDIEITLATVDDIKNLF